MTLSESAPSPAMRHSATLRETRGLAIVAEGVSKAFRRYTYRSPTVKSAILDWVRRKGNQYVEFKALDDVTFEIPFGQMIGIVGINGAGKSTLLRLLARLDRPTGGRVQVRGRVTPLLQLGAGMAPELTGRRNIYLYGLLLGLSRREIEERFDDIVAFSEIEDFIDSPIKHYSSGMYVRLAFSVLAHIDPDVLIIDEVLAVGDAGFANKCLRRIRELKDTGTTIVVATHALGLVNDLCDRAILLDHGRVLADDVPKAVASLYQQLTSQNVQRE